MVLIDYDLFSFCTANIDDRVMILIRNIYDDYMIRDPFWPINISNEGQIGGVRAGEAAKDIVFAIPRGQKSKYVEPRCGEQID